MLGSHCVSIDLICKMVLHIFHCCVYMCMVFGGIRNWIFCLWPFCPRTDQTRFFVFGPIWRDKVLWAFLRMKAGLVPISNLLFVLVFSLSCLCLLLSEHLSTREPQIPILIWWRVYKFRLSFGSMLLFSSSVLKTRSFVRLLWPFFPHGHPIGDCYWIGLLTIV